MLQQSVQQNNATRCQKCAYKKVGFIVLGMRRSLSTNGICRDSVLFAVTLF